MNKSTHFIGQQYIRIATMENIRQKVKWKQTFIQKKAPMLGAFKMSYLVYFVMLLYNSIFVIPSLEDRSLG